MGAYADSILASNTAYSGHTPAMALEYGGQHGHMARIGLLGPNGQPFDEWINNAAYVKRNVIPIVISYPRFFDFMPEKLRFIRAYKALLEIHPLTIDGLASGLTVETDEHPVGGAGEMQEEVTNVTRARSQLSFTFKEKMGKSVQKFLDYYIRFGIMDPDTKRPLVSRYLSTISQIGGMYTPDFYTGSMIFIEPDITHKQVVDAWLCVNMFPKSNGDRTGKRDIRSAGEIPEYSIEFTSLTMNNEAVLRLADSILPTLTVLNKIPDLDLYLPKSAVDAGILAQKDSGFNAR